MRAPVSVIIPTLNDADRIMPCLLALTDGVVRGIIRDVVLADGGSDDEISDLADGFGATFVQAPRGRGAQLAAGARHAKGEWLLFLHADTVPEPPWIDAVRHHCDTLPNSAGYFHLAFASSHWMAPMVAGWANMRSRLARLPYGDQGLLIHAKHYQAIGGHPEIPLMEDVAIARMIGRRLRPIGAIARTSAARYEKNGWVSQGASNTLRLARYLAGTNPETLARGYDGEQR